MTTKKDELFFSKIKEQSLANIKNDSRYSNLNLNQNRECSNVTPIHSNSKSQWKKIW